MITIINLLQIKREQDMKIGSLNIKLLIMTSLVVFILAGCSNSVPECGDEETTDLVISIADEEMTRQVGEELAELFTYSVESIRTTDVNDKTGAYKCAADLEITNDNTGEANEIPIEYTVESTDDGEEFYVNVFGL